MTMRIPSLLSILLCTFCAFSASAQDWVRVDGGVVDSHLNSVAILDSTRVVAVGEDGAIWASTNRGESWEKVYQANQPLTKVAGSLNAIIAIGRNGLVLRFDSSFANFENPIYISGDIPRSPLAVHDSATFYLLAGDSILISSHDQGKSYNRLPLPRLGYYNSILTLGEKTVLCASDSGLIARTTDAGQTWSVFNGGGKRKRLGVVKINDSSAVLLSQEKDSILHFTSNAGTTWIEKHLPQPVHVIGEQLLVNKLILTGPEGAFVNNDLGSTWEKWNSPGEGSLYYFAKYFDSLRGVWTHLYDTVYATFDGGLTWSVNNIPEAHWLSQAVYLDSVNLLLFIERPKESPFTSFAYQSTDGGKTWNAISRDFGSRGVVQVSALNSRCIYTLEHFSSTISISKDGAKSWDKLLMPTFGQLDRKVTYNGDSIFMLFGGGILKSSDYGKNWIPQDLLIEDWSVNAVEEIEFHGRSSLYGTRNAGHLFHSTNEGRTWERYDLPSGVYGPKLTFMLDRIYAYRRGGIYWSDDGGNSWESRILPFYSVNLTATKEGSLIGCTNESEITKGTVEGSWRVSKFNENLADLSFRDDLGFAVGDKAIYRTLNGGGYWDISFDPPNLSMGGVGGQTYNTKVRVSNLSSDSARLTVIGEGSLYTSIPSRILLAPKEQAEVTLSFTALSDSIYDARYRFVDDNLLEDTVIVQVNTKTGNVDWDTNVEVAESLVLSPGEKIFVMQDGDVAVECYDVSGHLRFSQSALTDFYGDRSFAAPAERGVYYINIQSTNSMRRIKLLVK